MSGYACFGIISITVSFAAMFVTWGVFIRDYKRYRAKKRATIDGHSTNRGDEP